MTTDPKIIAAMRRALAQEGWEVLSIDITNQTLSALAEAVLHPVDPDEEWREAMDAMAVAMGWTTPAGEPSYLDWDAVNKAATAGLRAAVPLSPPYKALQARLVDAEELLNEIEADKWKHRRDDINAYFDKHRERVLVEALVDHNDRLRSAYQIAARDGAETNWLAFRGQVTFTLAEHQETVNEARQVLASLKGESDAG